MGVQATLVVFGVNFFPSAAVTCSFGTTLLSGQFVSSTQLQCPSPSALPAGEYAVDVSCDGAEFTSSGFLLQLYQQPSVASIWPKGGAVDGSTVVTVRGSGFAPLPALSCQFGAVAVSGAAAVFISSSELQCTSPPSPSFAAGSVSVSVALDGVHYSSSSPAVAFLYFFAAQPALPTAGRWAEQRAAGRPRHGEQTSSL